MAWDADGRIADSEAWVGSLEMKMWLENINVESRCIF